MDKQRLIDTFKTNSWLVHRLAEGLTHEESLLRPPGHGNNFNWVVGHICNGRDNVLATLGESRLLDEAVRERYQSGSSRLEDASALPLPELLDHVDLALAAVTAAIENMPAAALAAVIDQERGRTLYDLVAGNGWHETYHVGQLEILRQLGSEKPAFP